MLQYNNYSDHDLELYKIEWGYGNYKVLTKELINYFDFRFKCWLVTKIILTNYQIITKFSERYLHSSHCIKRFLGAYDYFMSEDFRIDCKFLELTYDKFLGLNIEQIHSKYSLIINNSKLRKAV